MFDMLGKLGALASPEMTNLIESLPEKVADWTRFLNTISRGQGRLVDAMERVENNLAFIAEQNEGITQRLILLAAVGAVTPELQHEVEAMATADPRNLQAMADAPVQ